MKVSSDLRYNNQGRKDPREKIIRMESHQRSNNEDNVETAIT